MERLSRSCQDLTKRSMHHVFPCVLVSLPCVSMFFQDLGKATKIRVTGYVLREFIRPFPPVVLVFSCRRVFFIRLFQRRVLTLVSVKFLYCKISRTKIIVPELRSNSGGSQCALFSKVHFRVMALQ